MLILRWNQKSAGCKASPAEKGILYASDGNLDGNHTADGRLLKEEQRRRKQYALYAVLSLQKTGCLSRGGSIRPFVLYPHFKRDHFAVLAESKKPFWEMAADQSTDRKDETDRRNAKQGRGTNAIAIRPREEILPASAGACEPSPIREGRISQLAEMLLA